MKVAQFDKLTADVLMPVAARDGFELREGAVWRRRRPGIIDVVILDFDVRQGRTFNVIVGFSSDVTAEGRLPPECGVTAVQYLNGGGSLSDGVQRFTCFDAAAARQSLARVSAAWSVLLARFDSVMSFEQLADIVEPLYSYDRARLYAAAGAREKAVAAYETHIANLERQPLTDETAGYIAATREMIRSLE